MILLDNARIHKARIFQKAQEMFHIPIAYTGVAAYKSSPVELSFSLLKNNFNGLCHDTLLKRETEDGGFRAFTENQAMNLIRRSVNIISREKIRSCFPNRLRHLSEYLLMQKQD